MKATVQATTVFVLLTGTRASNVQADGSWLKEMNEKGSRADGNAFFIRQFLEFYLGEAGEDVSIAQAMLSYGCWCQIIVERKHGLGEPVDQLDLICKQYQQCSKCVALDNANEFSAHGQACAWDTAKYEVDFDPDTQRMTCNEIASGGSCGVSQCMVC